MDTRRVGHAQRRRAGAPSNVYDATTKQPQFGAGENVRASGRHGVQQIVDVQPNTHSPHSLPGTDGHTYVVQGGKGMRQSMHKSSELRSAVCPSCDGRGGADYSDPNYDPGTHGSAVCPHCGGKGYV